MKYLIVNGDDFGASRGVNRAIVESHRYGILTSTSLLVDVPWSESAAILSRALPGLSVGLHVDLSRVGTEAVAGRADTCRGELHRQFDRFRTLMGRPPTHLDSHHNVHRDPRLLPHFVDLAERHDLPLREHSPVRYYSGFYGQWGGETHLEQISVDGLRRILDAEVHEGVTELGCHPGYVDPDLRSGYAIERETEVRTLCHPAVPQLLAERQIRLVGFRDLRALAADSVA